MAYPEHIQLLKNDSANLVMAMQCLNKVFEHPDIKRVMTLKDIEETKERIKILMNIGILLNCRDILNLTDIKEI